MWLWTPRACSGPQSGLPGSSAGAACLPGCAPSARPAAGCVGRAVCVRALCAQQLRSCRRRWYLRFARQQLDGWSPILTGNLVVGYLLATAVVCFALGLPILLASTGLAHHSVRYDNAGALAGLSSDQRLQRLYAAGSAGVQQAVQITVPKRMPAPVRCPASSLRRRVRVCGPPR